MEAAAKGAMSAVEHLGDISGGGLIGGAVKALGGTDADALAARRANVGYAVFPRKGKIKVLGAGRYSDARSTRRPVR